MASTKFRSFLKACIWQISGVFVVFLLTKSLKISGFYFITRLIMYYLNERAWKKIKWGKQ